MNYWQFVTNRLIQFRMKIIQKRKCIFHVGIAKLFIFQLVITSKINR